MNISYTMEEMKIMNDYQIDWERTLENINQKLRGYAHKKDLSPILYLSERQTQNLLKNSPLDVERLYTIAVFLDCSIEDLLVFRNDIFISDTPDEVCGRMQKVCENSGEVQQLFESNVEKRNQEPIRNLQEFFHYLPLMDQRVLKDICNRVIGNLTYQDSVYFKRKISYLYFTIPDGPAKSYADRYCNQVLRAKGYVSQEIEATREEREAYAKAFWDYVSWWKEDKQGSI